MESSRQGLTLGGGDPEAKALFDEIGGDFLDRGGSMIIGSDSRVIASAGNGEETIHAVLDLGEIGEARAVLDVDGHYSRPDVFNLHVNRDPKDGVIWS